MRRKRPGLDQVEVGCRFVVFLAAVAVLAACSERGDDPSDPVDPVERDEGQSDFVSAASGGGSRDWNGGDGVDGAPEFGDDGASDGDGEERTVEEGDIYRLLGDGLILNLNSYRGLQVIDFSDPSAPEIVGRARVSGHPVELYVRRDHAFVLMNDWRGYYGSQHDPSFGALSGGLLLSVDISDPTQPLIVSQVHVPGSIRTSRLVHSEEGAALYVVAGEWNYVRDERGEWHHQVETYVRSFEVTGGAITPRSEIDLGGFVSDIQATSRALLVARNESWWRAGSQPSRVSIIDISSPDGTMLEGDEVEVAGFVFTQFNMDLHIDVLRVVSGSRWGSRPANYVQTFDATDFSNLSLIDEEEFGHGEDLYATLFLGNQAFFVTYFQVDPFHAFEITDEGIATEMSEFVVSGWNDYFRPVFNETRLIGIGKNDEVGNQQAVSLYDITDLTNPDPLLARAEVDMYWSWSEAQWDHRAFSVLQGAVDVLTEDGVQETGLVLLPFSGWEYDPATGFGRYQSAVQIFTFSESTLTRRGVMEHPSQVRRSFLAGSESVANLSETDLAFFDHTDPDEPRQLGSVELAPDYSDYLVFGDHAVRRKDVGSSWWYHRNDAVSTTHMQVIALDADPDLAETITSFEVARRAQVFKVGDLLVALWNRQVQSEGDADDDRWEDGGTVPSMAVYDMSNPLAPRHLVTADVSEALGSTAYWRHWNVLVAGEGIVFVEQEYHREVIESDLVCYFSPEESCSREGECHWNWDEDLLCVYDEQGSISCSGILEQCELDANGKLSCTEIDVSEIPGIEDHLHCWDRSRYRYWTELSLRPVDLSTPSQPAIRPAVKTGPGDYAANVFASGSDLYVSYSTPETLEGDERSYVRWFFKRIDLSNYAAPVVHEPINVPGMLLTVEGDFVYTRDFVYDAQHRVDTAIARCEVVDGRAYLRGVRVFDGRSVSSIKLDGAGNLLVTHGPAYWWDGPGGIETDAVDGASDEPAGSSRHVYTLSILDAQAPGFPVLSEIEVDNWAHLQDARPGRALFQVPGGLLVVNLEDPASPYPQSYFATSGWPRSISIHGGDILFAAGRYGIYRFPLDAFNLLPVL